jgi:hypothetical protein
MPIYGVSVLNTVQAVLFGTLDSRIIETCWCFQHLSGHYSSAQGTTLANNLYSQWNTRFRPLISQDFALNSVFIIGLDPFADVVTGKFGPTISGGVAEGSAPNNVGFRVELETTALGRAYRGWNTFVGIPRSKVTNSRIDQVWADALTAAMSSIGPLANALGWNQVIASTRAAGAPRVAGIATEVVSWRYKDLIVDSCRHRLPGRSF